MEFESLTRFNECVTTKRSGIYIIRNIVNNKYYIGSAINLAGRKADHLRHLRRSSHKNPHLQNSFNKYDEHNFIFYLAEYVKDLKVLIDIEQKWLDEFRPYNNKIGYNIAKIAGSTLGVRPSLETRRKQSIAAKKRCDHHSGEECVQSKLTWKNVNEIRSKYENGFYTHKKLSIEYGVNRRHIGDVLNRVSWDDGLLPSLKPPKLSIQDTRDIRSKYIPNKYSYQKLADEYGVGITIIINILKTKYSGV